MSRGPCSQNHTRLRICHLPLAVLLLLLPLAVVRLPHQLQVRPHAPSPSACPGLLLPSACPGLLLLVLLLLLQGPAAVAHAWALQPRHLLLPLGQADHEWTVSLLGRSS